MSWPLARITLFYRRPWPLQLRRHVSPPVSLARSYSSDQITPRRGPYRKKRPIQTLDPSQLRPSDFIDFSLHRKPSLNISNYKSFQFTYSGSSRFPDDTRGFLYYQSPNPGAPPAAGDLRFRLTPGNDPASFNQGSDLQLPNGLPWGASLLAIAHWQCYQPTRQLLIDDGLVTPALLETCTILVNNLGICPVTDSRIIHSFGQLFHVDFSATDIAFHTLSTTELGHRHYRSFFAAKTNREVIAPYQGSALCCFERSSLPQHRGTRTAVMRIVKIISPPTCLYRNYHGRIPLPVEGELVHRIFLQQGLQPISFNVDSRYHGLKMLFRDVS